MQIVLILLLFALGGALDGARDAIEIHKAFPRSFYFLRHNGGFKRWLLGTESEVTRLKFGTMINIPLNGWHVCKTLCYACLALATVWSGTNWWLLGAGWLIVRPIAQNTTQFSCLYNKPTWRMF